MKIAVPSEGNTVSAHFGHCQNFNIFNTDNGAIVSQGSVQNPGHRPGFLPVFLADLGVETIIAGGIGGAAVQLFEEKGIAVVAGASGDATSAVEAYLAGDLKHSGSICHEHEGGCDH